MPDSGARSLQFQPHHDFNYASQLRGAFGSYWSADSIQNWIGCWGVGEWFVSSPGHILDAAYIMQDQRRLKQRTKSPNRSWMCWRHTSGGQRTTLAVVTRTGREESGSRTTHCTGSGRRSRFAQLFLRIPSNLWVLVSSSGEYSLILR